MSLGQTLWHGRKGLITNNVHVKYETSTSNYFNGMATVKVRNVGQGHQPRCHLKGFNSLNMHAKKMNYLLRFKSYGQS